MPEDHLAIHLANI